ncbi:type 1 glutamine amidotransferase [Terasakiispira papahanaumokuakeensis]|nr:gamma-glutamyl-gamma-aminobutyrate hydrolase family protein [Terasakiispira papahanaumokuakeensis]
MTTPRPMNIGILVTGIPPESLRETYPSYAGMFVDLLAPFMPQTRFRVYDVQANQWPKSPQDCDGWIITGSKSGVYEDLPWMRQLQALIRDIADSDQRLVGICFGHQIMAAALGATVEKYSGGWGIGRHHYAMKKPQQLHLERSFLGEDQPDDLVLNAMHQDQVMSCPPGAQVLASSDFCPYAALVYEQGMLSFQPHPEFSIDYERDLLQDRQGITIEPEQAQTAIAGLTAQARIDNPLVGRWIARFLQGL